MRYIAVMVLRQAQDERDDPKRSAGHRRLSPTMSSRKLQALDFVKRYFAQWGQSPTLSELGAELGISSKRAHDLVHQLAREEMIEHITGKPRGIRLLDRSEELSEADVLVMLSRLGFTIGKEGLVVQPPRHGNGPVQELTDRLLRTLTDKGLHGLPFLDHEEPDSEAGEAGIHGQGEGAATAR